MATITVNRTRVVGDRKHVEATVALDSSYPTNGEDYTPAEFGLLHLDYVSILTQDHEGGNQVHVDNGLRTLAVFVPAGTEAASTSDQTALNDVRLLAVGW